MMEKVKGPASYFPSIEKTYGQPVAHWLETIAGKADVKHMDIVNWLKADHGLGHGHANALVAYALAKKDPRT
jgi:citrate synthase